MANPVSVGGTGSPIRSLNGTRSNSEFLMMQNGSRRERVEMYNANALKIGLFGANCSSARTATLVPERWLATWPDCLEMARIADDAGIDFLLPIGRWKGYGGGSNFHGTTFETVTWACGLLAATRRITVFGTVHAPLFHPLIAAKEMVTADHIGQGRFGLNIVAGWNEGEFEMFGVEQRDHGDRYEFAQEWIEIIKRAWSEQDEFDFDGKFFKLEGVHCLPGPYGGTQPVIMNAGASATGQAFAMRNCDAFFTSTACVALGGRRHRKGRERAGVRPHRGTGQPHQGRSARRSAVRSRFLRRGR